MAPYRSSCGALHGDSSLSTHVTTLLGNEEYTAGSEQSYGVTIEEQRSSPALLQRRRWLVMAVVGGLAVGTVMASNQRYATQASVASSALSAEQFSTNNPRLANEAERLATHDEIFSSGELASSTEHGISKRFTYSHVDEDVTLTPLDFTMTNIYHERDGKPGRDIPWLKDVKLAEPYRDTTLRVTAPRDGYTYLWEIRATDAPEEQVLAKAEGTEATMTFTLLDVNKMVLTEVCASTGSMVRQVQEVVMVKYVRREIRTLFPEERQELLDSMLKLWTVRVQDGNGREIYGDDYSDIWAINRLHFKAAGPFDCDHFHDGLGFLTSHSLLTNTFEYSLQRVNPKLTVPYWDFTIEKSTFGGDDGSIPENQANSPLFQSDWFGSQDADDQMVKDGRWAYTEVPRVVANNPGNLEVDVYSKLRAAWNVNDRAYLSRGFGDMCGARVQSYYPWPTCEMHYNLNQEHNDFYSYVWKSLYDPHGPVHVWLGGVMDCQETYAKVADLVGIDKATNLAYYSFIHRKNLFRDGFWGCEGTASVNAKPYEVMEGKQCGCLNYNLESGDDYITILNDMAMAGQILGDVGSDTLRKVVATLCSGLMNDGDHLQASSSLDPSFWVTHPTMERLFMFKRLTGTMTDLTWPDADLSYDDVTGEMVTETISLSGDSCVGHRGSDVFPFGFGADSGSADFKTRSGFKDDTDTDNKLSNRQVLQMLDPRVNGLNYIYDNFDWPHCAADGYDMNDAWDSGNTPASERTTFKMGEPRLPQYSKLVKDLRSHSSKTST